jgi:hypothetical protein
LLNEVIEYNIEETTKSVHNLIKVKTKPSKKKNPGVDVLTGLRRKVGKNTAPIVLPSPLSESEQKLPADQSEALTNFLEKIN